jgi:hypothetical protein
VHGAGFFQPLKYFRYTLSGGWLVDALFFAAGNNCLFFSALLLIDVDFGLISLLSSKPQSSKQTQSIQKSQV